MDDWGSGLNDGDLNGNGKFDPGDMEIWDYINKSSNHGGGYRPPNNDGNERLVGILLVVTFVILTVLFRSVGAIIFLLILYFYWISHK